MLLNGAIGGQQSGASLLNRRVHVMTEIREVFNAGGDPRDAFVVQRTPLPAKGTVIREGTHFVGLQAFKVLPLSVEHAHVRTKEFVSGANEKITIQRAHVNGAVGRVVDGINVTKGASFSGEAHRFFDIVDRAHRI